jgi:hypothetical protein
MAAGAASQVGRCEPGRWARFCHTWYALAAAALVMAFVAPTCGASQAARPRKVIIVVLHGVSWEELASADAPALQSLLRRAAVGVMNSRALGARDEMAPYVTIGAGRGAVGPAVDWTRGSRARPASYAQALRDANRRAGTQAAPGLLGTLARRHGLRTGLLSIPEAETRPLALAMVMDSAGAVDLVNHAWPGSYRGAQAFAQSWHEADLVAIDLAALYGASRARGNPPLPGAPDGRALAVLSGLDPVFDRVSRTLDPARDLLIVVSPTCPPYRSAKHIAYAPIAISGPGFKPGLLTSSSTRRPGMVANVDIAPTALQYLGLQAHSAAELAPMSGHPIRVVAGAPAGRDLSWRSRFIRAVHTARAHAGRQVDRPLNQILAISRRGLRLIDLQWRLGPVYAVSQFAAFMFVGGVLVWAPAWAQRRRRRLQGLLLLAMSVPLALLFVGPLDWGGFAGPYVMLGALALAFAWLAWAGSPPLTALGALLTTTSGIIVLDALTGGHLLDSYLVNFGAMSGSRFYGIGNEAMGVVVACGAIGSAALVQQSRARRGALWALGLWLIVLAAAVGAPFWGANWGGGVTAAFAFTLAYIGVKVGRPRLRQWAVAAAAAGLAGGLAVAVDMIVGPRTWTHIGDAAHLIGRGGIPAALTIAARKAHGNLRIIAVAPYTVGALVVAAAAMWLVLKPPARLRAALRANAAVWAGLAGGTAGAVIAVIVNDSGVVAASTAMGITASALAYVALEGDQASP